MNPLPYEVGSVGTRSYGLLEPLQDADAAAGYPLLAFLSGAALANEEIADLAETGAGGEVGWSVILDITRIPDQGLPYLAQYVGVQIRPDLDDDEQRVRIQNTDGWNRGTPAAIAAAAQQFLTGTKQVIVKERFDPTNPNADSPYHIQVLTAGPETPDLSKVLDALNEQKPAGIILHYDTLAGQTFQHLLDNHPLMQNVFADYATMQDIFDDTPGTFTGTPRLLFPATIHATATISGVVVKRGRILPATIHATATISGVVAKRNRILPASIAATSTVSGAISGSAVTFDTLTNWAREAFTVVRDRPFTTAAGLASNLSSAVAGDYIHYTGTGVLSISGEYTNFNIRPSGKVKVDLGLPSSANHVLFTGVTSAGAFPTVWLHDIANMLIYGGEITNALGKDGILVYGGTSATDTITWWDFVIHNVGGSGLAILPSKPAGGGSTISNFSFRGEAYTWGQHLAYDGHAEAGTGLHGCITADVVGGIMTNGTIAMYVHDGPSGAGLEIGQDNSSGGTISNITIYVKALNLTMVAVSQVAANAMQTWGGIPFSNVVVGWVEGTNLQGRVTDNSGLYASTGIIDGGKLHYNHGRHVNTNQNPNLGATEAHESPSTVYATYGSPTYSDCT